MVAVLFFCGGFWLVLRVLCELLLERLRSVIFLDFSCYLAKLSSILLIGVSDTVRDMRICGPTAGGPDAVVVNLRRLQRHLCIVLLPNKNV